MAEAIGETRGLAALPRLELLRFSCSFEGRAAAVAKRNSFGDDMGLGDAGASFLIEAAPRCLTTLDLAWNHLRVAALKTLQRAWPPQLSNLCLEWNSISVEGAECLAQALTRPNVLRRLDLRSNPLGDQGVLRICESLRSTNLQWLGLGETMLTDRGAELMCKALEFHPALLSLDIGENSITDGACQPLADFIQTVPSLKRLYLRGYLFEPTRITDAGGELLAHALESKHGFEIELDYQQVGCKTASALADHFSSWTRASLLNTNVSTMGALSLARAGNASKKWLNVAQCRIGSSAVRLLRGVGFQRLDSHGQRPSELEQTER